MSELRIHIEGLQSLQAKIKGFSGKVENILDAELEAAADNIELGAKQRVPDTVPVGNSSKTIEFAGQLRNSIGPGSNSRLHKEVAVRNINGKPMGAYVEFGTGVFIDIPTELTDYAMTFYVNGKGRIHASPFLFPAVEQERKDLIQRIKTLINEISR